LIAPLHPGFRPPILEYRAEQRAVAAAGGGEPLIVALERQDGLVARAEARVLPAGHPAFSSGAAFWERWLRLFVWSRGAARIFLAGEPRLCAHLQDAYAPGGPRSFDRDLLARVFGRRLEVEIVEPEAVPVAKESRSPLGGHFDGCRIGFDLGASDYKVAAVIEGRTVFTEELPWAPKGEPDPGYHLGHIEAALKKAASFLPRVDAIGGSAAGIYIDNRVKVATLFRAVPADVFASRVEPIFVRLGERWGVPLTVINDGDVAALAGSLSLDVHGILGIAMGSSQAAGYLDAEGHVTGWLNELGFAPVDLSPKAPVEEWSGALGAGTSSFSQQAVDRLARAAGIALDPAAGLPDRLEAVQARVAEGDLAAEQVFETVGVYLGYTIPWYRLFYDFAHLLILGRVTSGRAGEIIAATAKQLLEEEFPEVASRLTLHLPDEKSRRVGQAVAAASLPELE
jgi:predicted NBD/HSP70 family sugar kinase